jgi:thiol-disulfide isomerase/thioredoxin
VGRSAWAAIALWVVLEVLAYVLAVRGLLAIAPLPLAALPVLAARGRREPVHPAEPIWIAAAIFFFTYLAVPGFELYRLEPFESLPGYLRLSAPHFYIASWLGGLGFIVFCAVYFAPRRRHTAPPSRTPMSSAALGVAAGFLTGVGSLALLATLVLANAWTYPLSSIAKGGLREATLVVTSGKGYLTFGFLALSFGLTLAVMAAARAFKEGRGTSRRVYVIAATGAVAAVVIFGAVLGSRSLVVATVVQIAIVLNFSHRQLRASHFWALLGALAVFGIVFISLRNSQHVSLDPVVWAGYAAKTYDGFNFLAAAIARIHDPHWGSTMAQDVFWTYQPRFLLHSKPDVYGIVRAQELVIGAVGGKGTYPPGILAEGWINWLGVGAMAVAGATAYLLRVIWQRALWGGEYALLLLGWLLGNTVGLMRGLGPVLAALVAITVMVVPTLYLSRRVVELVPRRRWLLAAAGLVVAALIGVGLNPEAPPGGAAAAETPRVAVGQPQVAVVWASWCPACRKQLAELADPAVKDVPFVGVDFQDDRRLAAAAKREAGVHWPDIDDDGRLTIGHGGLASLPYVAIIDGDQEIICGLGESVTAERVAEAYAAVKQSKRC